MGWGRLVPASGMPKTREQREAITAEMLALYAAFARDESQTALVRMQAAKHLVEYLDAHRSFDLKDLGF